MAPTGSLRPNRILLALMQDQRLTQSELAERVNRSIETLFNDFGNCTDSHIRRWLSGDVQWPHPRYLLALEHALEVPALNLGFIPRGKASVEHLAKNRALLTTAHPRTRPLHQERGSVRRREFLGLSTGAAVLGASTAPQFSGRLGMSHLASFQDNLATLHATDGRHGGGELVAIAQRHYSKISAVLSNCTYSEQVGSALYSTAGEFATSAGWFAFDSGDQSTAEASYKEALRLSLLANDPTLQAHILIAMAIHSLHVRRASECVAISKSALSNRTIGRNPLIASLFHARAAIGHAHSGDAHLSARSMTQAERSLDRHSQSRHEPTPAWLAFYGPAELSGLAAQAHLALHNYRQAEDATVTTLAQISPSYVRNRFLHTITCAEAQLGRREIEHACTTASRALSAAPALRSYRGTVRLTSFRRAVAIHERTPAVQEFLGLTHNLDSTE